VGIYHANETRQRILFLIAFADVFCDQVHHNHIGQYGQSGHRRIAQPTAPRAALKCRGLTEGIGLNRQPCYPPFNSARIV
jgi:hypothetical protein